MGYRQSVRELSIRGDTIRVGQLLKLAGVVASGAEVKRLLAAGQVHVNGEPETRRGRQLHQGDVVAVDGEELCVSTAPGTGRKSAMLGLPEGMEACLFDLDGVLTQTARVHAAAWKQTFDEYLRQRAEKHGEEFREFDQVKDYDEYVDGLPRYDGVRGFLKSRGIELPEGSPDDPPDAETVDGIGNRKNELVLRLIHEQGVEPYEGSVRYVKAAKEAGLKRAVVSSSANARDVLRSAHMIDLFEEIIDGNVGSERHLKGKPAPDTFLAGARALGVEPAAAAVFEDALAGVQAGRAGHFGFVVGVDRVGQADGLREHGADIVVKDLAELVDRP
jgi:beta-phosphoglucomutase family hydrolase